ncbi:hypothetical protein CEXT_530291 [Caerostris extrusa]|uniref:Uncharacterized protein n=1 Tax=Caerostris extrusa TaxID=172846 RepID=A0AAV4XRW5_CAEEX|nr:hypothetical protein CEXT_530291 [Caerostris extrusa]
MESVSEENEVDVQCTDDHHFVMTCVTKNASTLRTYFYSKYIETKCKNFTRWHAHVSFTTKLSDLDMLNVNMKVQRTDEQEYCVSGRVNCMVFYDLVNEEPCFWQNVARPFMSKSFEPKSYPSLLSVCFKIPREKIHTDELACKICVRVKNCCAKKEKSKALVFRESLQNLERERCLNSEDESDAIPLSHI